MCVLQALLGIAKLDPDAVWVLLMAQLPASSAENPNSKLFPDAGKLLKHKAGLASEVQQNGPDATTKALLQQVEAMTVPWHKQSVPD